MLEQIATICIIQRNGKLVFFISVATKKYMNYSKTDAEYCMELIDTYNNNNE